MVRLLLLIMNLYYCSGFLPDGDLTGDPQMETLPLDVDRVDPGEPLFLTPYIEKGEIEEAQRLALVKLHHHEHIESYSGLLTVNKTYNTNLFFWYFPANQTSPYHNPKSAEVIIYLTSTFFTNNMESLHGLFQENGPIRLYFGRYGVVEEESEWSLNKYRHVIYIDHTPGIGFSFTDDWRGYPDSTKKIGELLYTAIVQIFKLFPVLQTKYLSIMGELLGAKYAVQLAYLINEKKSIEEIDIKLQRLYLISPWIDPVNQVGYYHKHAHDVGLIDGNMAKVILELQQRIQSLIHMGKWIQALSFYMTLYRELSGITARDYLFNLSEDKPKDIFNDYLSMWLRGSRRKALHVGKIVYQYNQNNLIARDVLKKDHMQSVQHELYFLARKNYYIFLASGPLSIVVPFRAMYDNMKIFDDRTNVVEVACLVDVVNKTYPAYFYVGGLENSRTVAVLQQKVGNFPWIDQPELTWMVVNYFHDFVISEDEVDDVSHSERLIVKLKNKKENYKVWGSN